MAETFSTKSSKHEATSEGGRPARQATPQSSSGPEARILHLQGAIGNRAVGRLLESQLGNGPAGNLSPIVSQGASQVIQTKLTVSVPGDKYEQEADSVAEKVMRMQDPGASPSLTTEPYLGTLIQRQCASCEEEDSQAGPEGKEEGAARPIDIDMPLPGGMLEEESPPPISAPRPGTLLQRTCAGCEQETDLQAKEAPGQTVSNRSVVHNFHGEGRPLNHAAREFFEPRFGYSFEHVRVHTDGRATESARAVNALAYTRGHDIVFGAGQYAPETMTGRRLLAHELTHVLQQNPSQASTKAPGLGNHSSVRVQAMPSGNTILHRWSIGPANPGLNTIVCDGKGAIRVQLGNTGDADQTACLSGCMRTHEESHRADALAENATICKDQDAGKLVMVDAGAQQKATEIKASNAEITCLKAIKATAKCKPIIQDRITQMEGYRDSFK